MIKNFSPTQVLSRPHLAKIMFSGMCLLTRIRFYGIRSKGWFTSSQDPTSDLFSHWKTLDAQGAIPLGTFNPLGG